MAFKGRGKSGETKLRWYLAAGVLVCGCAQEPNWFCFEVTSDDPTTVSPCYRSEDECEKDSRLTTERTFRRLEGGACFPRTKAWVGTDYGRTKAFVSADECETICGECGSMR